MNTIKHIKKYFAVSVAGYSLAAAMTSCADWNDHYEANTQVLPTQTATLWENIQRNDNLTDFAALLRQTGYDEVLTASKAYTVWAPLNGTYDVSSLTAQGSDRLKKEFIQNHIAMGSYAVSGKADEQVFMLNDKVMQFTGDAMQDISLAQTNVASANGVLHTLQGQLPFRRNIYESLSADTYPIDSISKYYHNYDTRRLDESKSVKGPTVNGEVTWLDSVFYESNDLYGRFKAYINREDSNYSMVVPTNEAWVKARKAISRYYNYVHTFEFMSNTATDANKEITTVRINAEYLRDSLTNHMLMNDLFYNNNFYDNGKLEHLAEGASLSCDSLVSTKGGKMYADDARRLFEDVRRADMSNGMIWLTDSLRLRPWMTWCPPVTLEAENSSMLANAFNTYGTPSAVTVTAATQNPAVMGTLSNGRYLEAQPSASNTNPEIDFYLPGIRSAEYSIYAVFVPSNIVNTNVEAKPYRMRVYMGYAEANGKTTEVLMRNPADNSQYIVNDPTRVDTVYLGDFTFPVAFVGTGNYYPYIRFRSNVTNSISGQYDRTLRLDCIILRPKELDAYINENPGYKYNH